MNTPIVDFVTEYCSSNPVRMHMPGHKGVDTLLNVEHMDITEIDGADNLWHPSVGGIIADSEDNASKLFGCTTFYSTEGSSLAIRGMLFLIKKWAHINGRTPLILAGRNAHKTFVNTSALLELPVKYMWGVNDKNYVTCNITPEDVEIHISEEEKPAAVYITTPDYLGNMVDVAGISEVCRRYGIFLLVDNAHGAYLKFLNGKSVHPMDLGADMCCDSAHKTLPALTGAAYLHVSNNTDSFFVKNAKAAMGMFGSTSPSYLIMQSLDLCNRYMADSFRSELKYTCQKCNELKKYLTEVGYTLLGAEPLKITLDMKKYGYTGCETAQILMDSNIYPEYYDEDYVVFMISTKTENQDIEKLKNTLVAIERKSPLSELESVHKKGMPVMSPYEAIMSDSEIIQAENSVGRILAEPILSCPPCVPEYMAGERITAVPKQCEHVRVVKQ